MIRTDFETIANRQPKLRKGSRNGRISAISLPNAVVDLANREVRYPDGQQCELSKREIALLEYLVHNPGRIISREELLLNVWQLNPQFIITRTIDMHVAKLREKLRDDPQNPAVLLTVRYEGYVFKPSPNRPEPVLPSGPIRHSNHPSLAVNEAKMLVG